MLHDLGTTLARLGEQTGNSDFLRRAVTAYREALKERTRARVPLNWAGTQFNLAILRGVMAERSGRAEEATQAVAHAEGALEVYREAGATHYIDRGERLLARLRAEAE